jgi:hypothetical protein
MLAPIDLVGQRFGLLTVLRLHPVRDSRGGARWVCACACGATLVARGTNLRLGRTSRCRRCGARTPARLAERRSGVGPCAWCGRPTAARDADGDRACAPETGCSVAAEIAEWREHLAPARERATRAG